MSYLIFRNLLVVGALMLSMVASGPLASTSQGSEKKPIIFKSPSGYMPAEFSGHTGKLFLDPKKPAGMFVGYPKEGQDMTSFTDEIKNMIAGMFMHDVKNPVWNSAALPSHKALSPNREPC